MIIDILILLVDIFILLAIIWYEGRGWVRNNAILLRIEKLLKRNCNLAKKVANNKNGINWLKRTKVSKFERRQ